MSGCEVNICEKNIGTFGIIFELTEQLKYLIKSEGVLYKQRYACGGTGLNFKMLPSVVAKKKSTPVCK